MSIKGLLQEEQAVSPVIGVILMVAITVILAAVIGSFVLGIGGSQSSPPQASFTCDDGFLYHNGGEQVEGANLDAVPDGTYEAGENLTHSNQLVWNDPDSDQTHILHEGC